MILITTSRRPTRRVRTFVKELERMIPSSTRLSRGRSSFYKLFDIMIEKGADKLIVIDVWKGNPGRIHFFSLEDSRLERKAVIWIGSLSLQLDIKERNWAKSLDLRIGTDALGDPTVERLSQFLRSFLKEGFLVPRKEGIDVDLVLCKRAGELMIEFVDSKSEKVLRPTIGVKKVIFY